jgi:alpha-tubulin suppressor-like RCC1 family protein
MSVLLVVSPEVEQQSLLLKNVNVNVLVTHNVSRETLNSYSRIGFLYHQAETFPFVLDDDESTSVDNLYFNNQWLTFFSEETKIVDLLSCEYHTDLYEYIKATELQTVINYSTDTTGNTPLGDWILEKSIQGNENVSVEIYVKEIYFTEGIHEWNVYLGSFSNRSFFINQHGKVYTCGLGVHSGISKVNIPIMISDISNQFIVQVSSGKDHSLFLTDNGKVYALGKNSEGRLGLGDKEERQTPTLISSLSGEVIKAISTGSYYTLFLTKEGKVYSCGENTAGQLGHGDKEERQTPTLISSLSDKEITAISSGQSHSLFLDKCGNVYSCGNNNRYQLGHGDTKETLTPKLISTLSGETVDYISAGVYESIVRTTKNKLYGFGDNTSSKLGITGTLTSPKEITSLSGETIISVSISMLHSVFLTTQGKVYSCGNSTFIGRSTSNGDNIIPRLIDENIFTNKTIIAVQTGFNHTQLLDWFGKVYTFGSNNFGQLGHGNYDTQFLIRS